MRKQAINEQRQRKHRENTLIDYKDNEKQQTNSMGNSNEIRPLPTRNEGAASGEEDPHKLYNNFWDFGSGVIEFKDAENCQKMMKLLSEDNVEIGDIKQKEYDPKLYNKKIHFVPLHFIGKNPFEVKC